MAHIVVALVLVSLASVLWLANYVLGGYLSEKVYMSFSRHLWSLIPPESEASCRRRCTWNDSAVCATLAARSVASHFLMESWLELAMGVEEQECAVTQSRLLYIKTDTPPLYQYTKSTV